MSTKNERFEEKAVDTANISDWTRDELSDMVDTAQRANRVMRQLSATVADISSAPTDTYKHRARGNLSAASQSENTQITSEDLSHSNTPITVSKVGKRVVLTREGEEDGMDSQADEIAVELGEALADKEDQDAYNTVASGSLTNQATQDNGTDGTVKYSDVNQLRAQVKANDYEPDALVIHPDHEADLLEESKFIDASQYAGSQPIRNGEIGRFLNMRVYVTSQANSSNTNSGDVQGVILDSSEAFVTVMKRDPTVEMEFEEDYDRWQIVGTMRYGHGVINEEAIGHIVN